MILALSTLIILSQIVGCHALSIFSFGNSTGLSRKSTSRYSPSSPDSTTTLHITHYITLTSTRYTKPSSTSVNTNLSSKQTSQQSSSDDDRTTTINRTSHITVTSTVYITPSPSVMASPSNNSSSSDTTLRITSFRTITLTRTITPSSILSRSSTRNSTTSSRPYGVTSVPGSCQVNCGIEYPDSMEWTWAAQSYTETVSAGIILVIVNGNITRTTTSFLPLPSGYTLPPTNLQGTQTTILTYYGSNITLAYPTNYQDYESYYRWSGTRMATESSTRTCISATTPSTVTFKSHPPLPRITAPINPSDPGGLNYKLMPGGGRGSFINITMFPELLAFHNCSRSMAAPAGFLETASFLFETVTSTMENPSFTSVKSNTPLSPSSTTQSAQRPSRPPGPEETSRTAVEPPPPAQSVLPGNLPTQTPVAAAPQPGSHTGISSMQGASPVVLQPGNSVTATFKPSQIATVSELVSEVAKTVVSALEPDAYPEQASPAPNGNPNPVPSPTDLGGLLGAIISAIIVGSGSANANPAPSGNTGIVPQTIAAQNTANPLPAAGGLSAQVIETQEPNPSSNIVGSSPPEAPAAPVTTATYSGVFTVGEQTYTYQPGADTLDVGSTVISIGGVPVVLASQTLSLGTDGVVIATPPAAHAPHPAITATYSGIFTVGGLIYTNKPGVNTLDIGSTTISVGGGPVTVNGQTISLGGAGVLVATPAAISPVAAAPKPAATTTYSSVFSVGGQAYTYSPGDKTLDIGSAQLSVGGGAVTVNSQVISLGTAGVAIATPAADTPEATPVAAVFTVGGQTYTYQIGDSTLVLGATTITSNGAAATIGSQVVTLGSSGLIIGGSTITPAPLAASTPLVLTLVGETIAWGSGSSFVFSDQTVFTETFTLGSGPSATTIALKTTNGATVAVVNGKTTTLQASPGASAQATISLAPDITAIVINSMTVPITPRVTVVPDTANPGRMATTTELPIFTVGGETIAITRGSAGSLGISKVSSMGAVVTGSAQSTSGVAVSPASASAGSSGSSGGGKTPAVPSGASPRFGPGPLTLACVIAVVINVLADVL